MGAIPNSSSFSNGGHLKFCGKCKKDLEDNKFSKRNKGNSHGLQAWCKKCSNANRRKDYFKNQEREIKVRKDRKDSIREFLVEYKSKLFCAICGENHPATLDFHHVNPEEKDFRMADAVKDGYSIKKILEEIQKCQVLCANCHRKLHYNKTSE